MEKTVLYRERKGAVPWWKGLAVAMGMVTFFPLVPLVAVAEGAGASGSASWGVFSNYIWRGQRLSDRTVVQLDTSLAYKGASVGFWANYDTHVGEVTEVDYLATYSFSAGKAGLELGYIYYSLEGVNDTQEFYLSASYDVILAPSLTIYYDFDLGTGAFVTFSIGHSFSLPAGASLDLSALVSVNLKDEVLGDFYNFYNAEAGIGVGVPLYGPVSLSLTGNVSVPLSGEAKDAIEVLSVNGALAGSGINYYGGASVAMEF